MTKKRSTATRRAKSEAAAARAAAIREEQERRERRRRSLVVGGVAVLVLALVLMVGYVVQSSRDTTGAAATAPTGAVGGYAVPAGPSTAPLKVAVYEDFLGPFCEEYESAGRASFAKDIAAGKVQFQYHVLTFLDDKTSTEYSSRAANALAVVLDASGPSVAKAFHDLLFEHQPAEGSAGLTDAQLVDYAVQAGATRSAVSSGISGRTFEQWVANVGDRASKDGVSSTPTVEIDGRTVSFETTDELVAAVQDAVDAG